MVLGLGDTSTEVLALGLIPFIKAYLSDIMYGDFI